MLEQDGCTLVPLDKFANGKEINEGNQVFITCHLKKRPHSETDKGV